MRIKINDSIYDSSIDPIMLLPKGEEYEALQRLPKLNGSYSIVFLPPDLGTEAKIRFMTSVDGPGGIEIQEKRHTSEKRVRCVNCGKVISNDEDQGESSYCSITCYEESVRSSRGMIRKTGIGRFFQAVMIWLFFKLIPEVWKGYSIGVDIERFDDTEDLPPKRVRITIGNWQGDDIE